MGRDLITFVVRGISFGDREIIKRLALDKMEEVTGIVIMGNVRFSHIGAVEAKRGVGTWCLLSKMTVLTEGEKVVREMLVVR